MDEKDVTQKMICPPCMGLAGWNGRAADSIGTLDALNGILYPCKLGSPSGAFLDPIY